MSGCVRLGLRIYRFLLSFYPPIFRHEFGDEMQAVFTMVIFEAGEDTGGRLLRLCAREFRDWLGSVLREHLQERRGNMLSINGFGDEKPLRRSELLAALTIFLIPPLTLVLVEILGRTPQLGSILLFLILGSAVTGLIIAIFRGLPRWSPPYLGFLLIVTIYFSRFLGAWGLIYPFFFRIFGRMDSWSLQVRVVYQELNSACEWFLVLLTAVIVIFLLRICPLTGTIWQRIRDDWTQLSFIIYGGIVWYIVLVFDEYSHDEPWLFAAWISLALGCWLYLKSREPIQRILILLCGATLAMWIVAGGKWILTPLQNWPVNLESERWFEFLSAMVSWVAIIVVLMIPVLLNLLPQRRKSIPNENPVT